MLGTQFLDLDQDGLAMLVDGIHRQIHYLLVMIEAMIRQTTAASVEDYRAQLMTRIGAFRTPHVIPDRSRGHSLKMTDLIERTLRPYCTTGGRVIVSGPDLLLAPKLSFALHLIFSELALNAKKYGSLRCSCGQVEIQWRVRSVAGASRKLAVVWSENGGPEVKRPRCRGFGTQLLKRAIEGYGAVQLYFNKTGLACSMLIELDHVETPFHSQHPHEQFGINGGGARVRNAAWPNMRPQCGDGIDFKRMRDRIGAELPRAESGSRSRFPRYTGIRRPQDCCDREGPRHFTLRLKMQCGTPLSHEKRMRSVELRGSRVIPL